MLEDFRANVLKASLDQFYIFLIMLLKDNMNRPQWECFWKIQWRSRCRRCRAMNVFCCCCIYFFSFVFVFVSNHNFPFGFFPSILTAGPLQLRGVFVINVFRIGSFFHCPCIADRDMKHLKSSESTPTKSQNDRPSPEIPHESRASLWR